MRGRRPAPTVLKLLKGNPGKRALNPDEPRPEVPQDAPPCPTWLEGEGRKEWNRLAPHLHALGLLTAVDLGLLAAGCQAFGRWREYEALCSKVGPAASLELKYRRFANQALANYLRIAAEFGLGASARARMKAPGTVKKSRGGAHERFFGRKRDQD